MQTIESGGLEFVIENRIFGKDGGPALRVFGNVDGESVQVLRFDCFRDDPHYHYAPTGKNEMHHLEKGADNMGWSIEQVKTRIDEMIRMAGYDALADSIDVAAIQAKADDLEHALRTEPVVTE
ncbi:MAG: hypothetical protein HN521_04370 [Candidatus Latescibacteria bacterium]|jgi:hypothetical protein|nr:hypothetical protein [Candidatus Latescibacterota bacterium]